MESDPNCWAIVVALVLDRVWGEPRLRWHPVAWMGRYLGWIGGLIAPRSAQPSPNWTAFWAGALAWYGGAVMVGIAAWGLQWDAMTLHPLAAGALVGVMLKPMLSWKMLRDEVMQVEQALSQSLDAGRRQLGRIVSREVMQLDESQVRESAIESLAENLNDSVVAPLFWFVVAGLPGAVVYRFANTADAMWGYRGFRAGVHWEWAGKWAARADDVLSWIPARLTALLLAIASADVAVWRLRREAKQTPSPNSGWPMAAMALALGVRLRKPGVYALNASGRAPGSDDTVRAVALGSRSIVIMAAWAVLMLLALQWGRAV
ncbi:adenosylcobinamide-phosphate synthase CbiB [Ramlibacter albus]|uniref:Cobalamin biosynthesis protein CobD n=1 Tax=Ramlibacter albus TaxID=2079448 RepID=A0A923MC76_9BURK|nr:adenosylcobinamide-phosphate synthase CbiB [Ramlibacter albus]MBC5767703.1 cobalamin biosynthesis protein CobD [Ramlibacter albus]